MAMAQQEENSNRQIILGAVSVILLVLVGVYMFHMYQSMQPHVVTQVNVAPYSGVKGAWLKQQKDHKAPAQGTLDASQAPGPN